MGLIIKLGVCAIGFFLSPNPQILAYLCREITVRPIPAILPSKSKYVLNHLKSNECTQLFMGTRLALVLLSLFLLPLSSAGVYYTQIEAVDGKIWFDCDDSTAILINSTGHELFNSTDFDSEIEAGNYTLVIQDVDECQGVVPLTEELPNLRPGPGTFSESIDTVPCIITGFSLGCNSTTT